MRKWITKIPPEAGCRSCSGRDNMFVVDFIEVAHSLYYEYLLGHWDDGDWLGWSYTARETVHKLTSSSSDLSSLTEASWSKTPRHLWSTFPLRDSSATPRPFFEGNSILLRTWNVYLDWAFLLSHLYPVFLESDFPYGLLLTFLLGWFIVRRFTLIFLGCSFFIFIIAVFISDTGASVFYPSSSTLSLSLSYSKLSSFSALLSTSIASSASLLSSEDCLYLF